MNSAEKLPSFKKPPIIEVVLGVQFLGIKDFHPVKMGAWWELIKKDFPKCQQVPKAAKMTLSPHLVPLEDVRIDLNDMRVWFLNQTEDKLIQVQRDRFLFNWRKRVEDSVYPRYHLIKDEFSSLFDSFNKFVNSANSSTLSLEIADITYINHIFPNAAWQTHAEMGKVVSLDLGNKWGTPDTMSATTTYNMNKDGRFVGRYSTVLAPGFSKVDRKPLISLQIDCVGQLQNKTIDDALILFDTGHDWIVKKFDSLTTSAMHDAWERNND